MSAYATSRESGRLYWLAAMLGEQKRRVRDLLARVGDLGVVDGMTPSVMAKFFHMLDQVAVAKSEEVRLIGQIESVEQQHRFRRKNGSLKMIRSDQVRRDEDERLKLWAYEEEQDDRCDENSWANDNALDDKLVAQRDDQLEIAGIVPAMVEEKRSGLLWLWAFLILTA
jgi:hypothetical protein